MKKIIALFLLFCVGLISCTVVDDALLELVLEIKNQNLELLEEVKSLQSKSDSLVNELKKSAAKQEEVLKKVTDLQAELAKVVSQIGKLSEQLTSQDTDLEAIKSQLADLQKKYEGILLQLEQLQKLSQILAEIEKLKGQLAELDGKYQVIQGSLAQNKEQLDALKGQVTALQTQLAENLTKISQLTSQLGAQGADIEKILAAIEELKKSCAEIKALLENQLSGKSPIPTNGLVGWWPFNGNANDESGNGLIGVVSGAKLGLNRSNEPNKAYEFQSNSLNTISMDLRSKYMNGVSNQYSFLMWVKANRSVNVIEERNLCNGSVSVPMAFSNQNWAFNPYESGTSKIGIGLSIGTNGIFVANHATNLLISRASVPGQFNGYQFIVVTQKENSMNVFINGNLVKTIPAYCLSSEKKIGEVVFLGGSLYSPNFSGVIDDFAIWNRALTPDEVSKIYKGEGF